MSGGPSLPQIYTVVVQATSPTGKEMTFELIISVRSTPACMTTPIIPSVLADQKYFVRFPMGDYDPPAFTIDPPCGQTIVYTNTVTINNFVNDNLGDGKYITWQTADDLNIGTYTVTVTGTNYCQTGVESYILDVRSTCEGQLLQIDPTDLKFTSPALIQNVWQPFGTLAWYDTDVIREYPAVDCGPIEFELVTQTDAVPDLTVFTPDSTFDPRQLDVYT